MISPWVAFLVWVPISVYFFQRYPVRVAVLANFIGGWAVLPSARFTPTAVPFPYWILGTCLPSDHFFTKASVTGITCLLGMLLFDRRIFSRFQLNFWDLPMVVWCTVPLFSAFANSQTLFRAASGELYQTLAWGVPYLAGRLYFNDTESLGLAAKSFVLAGMAYIPVCLIEIFTGPQLYAHLYGYEPYRWVGAQRYLGFRPIGLLEDGNQLGVWMATSALIAIWLWKSRLASEIVGISMAWISGILLLVTLLCQSIGSIVLLFCLLPFVFLRQSKLPRALAALLLAGIVGCIGLRLSNTISLKSLVEHNRAVHEGAQLLREMQRGSFGWRLSQDEKHVTNALEKPILGSGQWDWWRASSSRPWGLWLLAFGMYGMVGLLALECLQLLPVGRVWWALEGSDLRSAFAGAILLSAIDNLLNGSMILPLLLVIGGLSGPSLALASRVAPQRERLPRGDWEAEIRTPSLPTR